MPRIDGSVWRDKSHFMKLLRNKVGHYSIKFPVPDDVLMTDVIQIDTLPTFSAIYPMIWKLPVDLNEIRVHNDRQASSSDVSDIYRIPPIFPKDSDRFIVGLEKITWFNDMRYQAYNSTYETTESYQALAVAQGVANLASTMEPPYIEQFIPPDKFSVSNGNYYKDRVVLHIEYSYSKELYDIPMGKRIAFFKLALLDCYDFLWSNMSRFNLTKTAIADLNLGIDKWESAAEDRAQLLEEWKNTAVLSRLACKFF